MTRRRRSTGENAPTPLGRRVRVAFLTSAASLGLVALGAISAGAQDTRAPGAAAATTTGDAARVRTLAELTRAATEYNPGVRAADHAIAAAEARLDEVRLSPFFQFEVTGGLAVAPSAQGTPTYSPDGQLPLGNPWRPILSIEVEGAIPVYTFGKLINARRAGRAGVRAAGHDRERTVQQTQYDVRRAYFALQLALDVQQMLSEGLGRLETAVSTLQEQVDNDEPDANPMDIYRLAAALAEVQARASEVTRLEVSSRAALETLTGLRDIHIPDCPSARVDVDLLELSDYVARAHGHRPELGMLEAALDARRAELNIHRARFFPDLALGLRAGYSWGPGVTNITNPFISDRANTQSLGAALVMRWNLDFVGGYHRTRRSEAQLAQLQAQDQQARDGVRLEVIATYEQLRDADRREVAWAQGERQTRSWFVAAGQAYQVGTSEPRELVDAMKAYFTNRFNHLEALREFNTAAATLERVTGAALVDPEAWERSCTE
ncbi:MAG: TolC family protein [Polyangiales bacterium]|nr:TolC family protein [Sandaracinaceae bacterium]